MKLKTLKTNTALLILLIILTLEQFSVAALTPEIESDNIFHLAVARLADHDINLKNNAKQKLLSGYYSQEDIFVLSQEELQYREEMFKLIRVTQLSENSLIKLAQIWDWDRAYMK